MHVFTSVINTGTLVVAFLAINLNGKKFQWFSLIWAALFLLLNIFHLAGDGFAADDFDLSQVVLLSFVLVVNATLVITLWKSLRRVNNQSTNVA
jgi:hypothetical protein